jgi:biotin carboxyl carrier protein
MKLKVELEGSEHELALTLASGGAVAEVDGRRYQVDIHELSDGEYLLVDGTRVFRCRIESRFDSRTSLKVVLQGRSHDITIIDPRRLRSGHAASTHDHGSAEIVSPMPGKVVRVLVEVGATVEAGSGVIVVEAMKMQNELRSPKAGVVVSINAEAGATVNAGDVLAVIE